MPLTYAGKENYLSRLLNTPDLPASIEITLPSMSFNITDLEYDAARKLQSGLQSFQQTATGVATQYNGVPYNLGFELNIYIRNIDDGLQIVEQILPFFNPDYTITINYIDSMGITHNAPIIIDSVQMPNEFEGGADETERRLVWTIHFTMQTSFYGPISSGSIIRQTITNINYLSGSPLDEEALIFTTANTPLGNFALGEIVYQGDSLQTANAIGTVSNWNYNTGQLAVTITSGQFLSNVNVHGVNFGSSVEILTVPSSLILATIVDTVDPANASISDDFGFTSYITEFPFTGGSISPPAGSGGGDSSSGANGSNGSSSSNSSCNACAAFEQANAAYFQANTANVIAFLGLNTANSAYRQANLAYAAANAAQTNANFTLVAYSQANTAYTQANSAYTQANLAYAAANSAGSNVFNLLVANTINSNVYNIGVVSAMTTITGTTTSNSIFVVDNVPANQFTTIKYIIQLVSVIGYQATELLVIQDGVSTYTTEYATILSANAVGTFNTAISGVSFNLNFTPFNPLGQQITYKILRTAITS